MEKPKILIGVACSRTILVKTAFSIIQLLNNPSYDTEVVFMEGVYVHENYNNIVYSARKKKCSHILFVDHDMIFEPNTLEKLLFLGKDIVAAKYNFRFLPETPMLFDLNEKGEPCLLPKEKIPAEPFKCYGIPTGCTLVRTSVFEKIKFPWFFFEYNDANLMKETQDIYFCKKAREAGFELWVDPTIEIKHIGDYEY